jgi:putative ABC transport system permease protein
MHDIRYAFRTIAARPWFAGAIVVTLALGIGINTAVFSLVKSVLFEPLPFAGGERIVTVAATRQSEPDGRMNVSWLDLQDYQASSTSFEALGGAAVAMTVLAEAALPPEVVRTARVDPGVLTMTRVAPILGRTLQSFDSHADAANVVVLSHALWTTRYAADPGVVGRHVRVDNQPATVVGVMPAGFQFPNREQMWMVLVPTEDERTRRDVFAMLVVGKLKPDVTQQRASSELQSIAARIATAHPDTNKEISVRILTFNERFNGGEIEIVFLLMFGAVGLVLVVVCANVANMVLTRALGRRRELTLHSALGASRPRIVRRILTECLLLSLAGSVFGLVLAGAGVRVFDFAVRDVGKPSWIVFGLDYATLAYCALLCLVAALLAGLMPALRASRADAAAVLREGGRSGSHHGGRLSAALVVCQFALAVVLLAGAGLLVRSFLVSQQRDGWIASDRILAARLNLPSEERYSNQAVRQRFLAALRSRMAVLPGASSVGLASHLPGEGTSGIRIELEGQSLEDSAQRPMTWQVIASPGYLPTIGLAISAGRDFDETDGAEGREAAIVTREFADRFLSGTNVLGRRFRTLTEDQPGPWITIVGVAGSMAHGDRGVATDPAVFIPLRQTDRSGFILFVAAAADPLGLADPLRQLVQSMDPDLPLADVEGLDVKLARSRWAWAVFGTAFSIFAAAAVLLSGVGLYAVMSQSTARRTREIGIRMALGATPAQVLRTVMMRGVVQIAAGLAGGLALAWLATDAMRAVLFGVTPHDPVVLVASIAILLTIGAIACVLPVRRAVALSPVRALAMED